MKKYLFFTTASVLVSLFSVAQDTRAHIEKALTDPKASENAAKADVLLIDKTNIKNNSDYDRNRQEIKKEKNRFKKSKKISPKK